MGDIMNEKDNIRNFTAEKEKAEKKSEHSNQNRGYSKILLILCSVFCVVLVAVYFLGGFDTLENVFGTADDGIYDSSVVGGDGFPMSFTSNDIKTVKSFSSRLFVLTEKLLTCVRSNGKVEYTKTFTFVEPELTVSDKYGLIYDRSSSKYLLFNSKGTVYEGTTEGDRYIITATVDGKGNIAFATKSDDSACRVYLVNKNGEILFIWSCAEEYVVKLDISSDAKEILCAALGAYNGEIYTKLYKHNIKNDKKQKEFIATGAACVDVCFYGKDKAIVTCLDKRILFNLNTDDGSAIESTYPSEGFLIDSDMNGYTAVISNKITSFENDEVILYDKNNSVVYKADVPDGVIDVEVIGKKVYCLTADSVIYLSDNGQVKKSVECEAKGNGFAVMDKKAYYYSLGTLRTGF